MAGELREWLGAGLVEYTVPGRWVDLERSPRTASASPPGAPSEPAVLLATGLGPADVAELDAGAGAQLAMTLLLVCLLPLPHLIG